MNAHLPISITGYNVYHLATDVIKVSQSNKRCLSLVQRGDEIRAYRIPDHVKLDNPALVIKGHLQDLTADQIKSLIQRSISAP